jgi:NAD dependent epimerase/dehydratase family
MAVTSPREAVGAAGGERPPLVLLGVGNAGFAVAACAAREDRSDAIVGTTRDAGRAAALTCLGIRPLLIASAAADAISPVVDGADVVVTFPPDGVTDRILASPCARARAVVYVSSTTVYGARRGVVDETTPVAPDAPRARARVEAEDLWRGAGATVLRAPGLYGRTTGLHVRLREGTHRIPGDGSGLVSRIHLDDLATFILAALRSPARGEAFVVGDLAPVAHAEVVGWLCARMGLPFPPHVAIAGAPESLRGSRAVDATAALQRFRVTLRYPTYREGFADALRAAEESPPG